MSACKTLIRASLSWLELPLHIPNSTSLRRFSSSISPNSGQRIKWGKPFSISRSYGCTDGAIQLETSTAPLDVNLEASQDSCNDTVEKLLAKDNDDVSRLMKMERRLANADEFGGRKRAQWFPYLNRYNAGDVDLSSDEVLEAMDPYLMDTRKERFRNVVSNRSYSVCLVIEGLSDFGNVSAAFRSADALGIQSVHVVSCDGSRRYRDNRHVSMGAEKWLDIEVWSSIKECFGILKARGYRIAATHLGQNAVSVYDVNWSCPTAIVVGNEHRGISEEALELADLQCSIPMRGMVDSFNVSAAATLLMHQAVWDRTLKLGRHGDLTEEEQQILVAEFYLRHNKNTVSIASEFSKRRLSNSSSPVPRL